MTNATHISAHAQYRNLREAFGYSLFATEISVALSVVVVPLARCNFYTLDFMEERTLKILL